MNADDRDALEAFSAILAAAESRDEGLQEVHRTLKESGRLGLYLQRRYVCAECGVLCRVFRYAGVTFAATAPYKLGHRKNLAESVPEARQSNTLDGERHWPGHVYDVHQLAEWGDEAGATVTCRHINMMLTGSRILADIAGVRPGKQGPAIILWKRGGHAPVR